MDNWLPHSVWALAGSVLAFIMAVGFWRSNRRLRLTEEKYESVFHSSSEAILEIGMDGVIHSVNAGFTSLTGIPSEDLINHKLRHYLDSEMLPQGRDSFIRVLAGETVSMLVPIRHREGHWVELEIMGLPLRRGRRIIGAIAMAKDVTEARKAERILKEKEERYRSLFDNNPDGVCEMDLNGRIVACNDASIRMLGYSMEELQKTDGVPAYLPDRYYNTVFESFNKAIRGEPQLYECGMIRKDGDPIYLKLANIPIVVGGEVTGVYGIAKDVSTMVHLTKVLEEARSELEHIFNTIDIVVTSWDAIEERYVKISAACDKMFGFPVERFYENSRLIKGLIHPEDAHMAPRMMETAASGRIAYWEFRIVLQNEEMKWLESRVFPSFDVEGRFHGITTVLTDITVRKMLALREAGDLELARRVQQGVLSIPVEHGGLRIDARYIPSQALGGDMYAWYPIDGTRYGLMILDVMGNGISSSLICMSVRALLKGLITRVVEPEQVMEELNQHMLRLFRDNGGGTSFFFSALYAVVDTAGGTIEYCNAGHCPAFLADSSGMLHRLEPTTVPIGLLEDMPLMVKQLSFTGSARLLMYTDGLVEVDGASLHEAMDALEAQLQLSFREGKDLSVFLDEIACSRLAIGKGLDDISMVGADLAGS